MDKLSQPPSPPGYANPQYAYSLKEFGEPLELPHSKGWLLKREIPGTEFYDAMGCYPLFVCQDWQNLYKDIDALKQSLISVSLVSDPFGNYKVSDLKQAFTDVLIPFKKHFIADLDKPIDSFVSKNHRYKANRALKQVDIEIYSNPVDLLDEWMKLYDVLIKRHELSGIKAFSRFAFQQQLTIPGAEMVIAVRNEEVLGAQIWYKHSDVVYSHLVASSEKGYELRVSYAIHYSALKHFQENYRWINLGAGAGIDSQGSDGLSQFKRGWSTEQRQTYFCGQILNHSKYNELVKQKAVEPHSYFPLYRLGEFS